MAGGCAGGTAAGFVESFAEIEPRGAKSRDQTKQNSGEERCSDGEDENPAVDADHSDIGNAAGGEAQKRREREIGEEKAEHAAEERDEDPLGGELANAG